MAMILQIYSSACDSLQRHMTKHGAKFTPNSAGRSKRACLACRVGKVKCDGNDNCGRCLKKGVECKYRQQDNVEDAADSRSSSNERESPSSSPELAHSVSTDLGSTEDGSSIQTPSVLTTFEDAMAIASLNENNSKSGLFPRAPSMVKSSTGQFADPATLPSSSPSAVCQIIGLKTMQVLSSSAHTETRSFDSDLSNDPASQEYLNAYFEYFHPHWPIMHRPSIASEKTDRLIVESMKMIGAWMIGGEELKQYAISCHSTLTDQLLPRLGRVSSHDKFQQSLSANTCQAALLNIIFGLYYGNNQALSRATMLRNILVAALREVRFFCPHTVWADEKPGYFLPLRLAKAGERQRLASYLFNVDAYLSILQTQPALTTPEDLHYTLPSTFAFYNADGLHVWAERHLVEPFCRNSTSLCNVIRGDIRALGVVPEFQVLIEDIQSCLCGLQSSILKVTQSGMGPRESSTDINLQKDFLRKQLDALKSRLDQMANQTIDNVDFGHERHLPMRYYYGYEDQSHPGWQNVVITRVRSLLFDTTMLYYLLSHHLSADISRLTQMARDMQMEATEELSENRRQALEQRKNAIIDWIPTPSARFALCQAVDVLVAHQNMKGSREADGLGAVTLHPVSYIALCASALVVWAYCNFRHCKCDFFPVRTMPFVELTRWAIPGTQFEKERASWVESRGNTLLRLQGIPMCQCNLDFLMIPFQGCLPRDWDIAEMVAPGVFMPIT
ncbi:hypothetical protein B7463_g4610, partial [Scytalidium lignicola]